MGNSKKWSSLYLQILAVVLAFTLLVTLSYTFGNDIVRKHLRVETGMTLSGVEKQIHTGLNALQWTLNDIIKNMRNMLMEGAQLSEAEDYIREVTRYNREELELPGFMKAACYFDIFDGAAYSPDYDDPDNEFRGGDDWDVTARPWYIAAEAAADGEIASTDIYVDAVTGGLTFTYAGSIFDDSGNRLAIVSIDVLLDQIYGLGIGIHEDQVNYWVLLDRGLKFMSHPDEEFLGAYIGDKKESALSSLAGDLKRGNEIIERSVTNYKNEKCVITIRQLENGWHLAVVTPTQLYYRDSLRMLWGLIVIGMFLAGILCLFFVRTYSAKKKSEDMIQKLINFAPYGMTIFGKNGKIIGVNGKLMEYLGLQINLKEETWYDKFLEVSPEYQPNGGLSSEKLHEYMKIAEESGECNFEWMHTRPNGESFPCEMTFQRLINGKKQIFASYVRDLRFENKLMTNIEKISKEKQNLANLENILNGLDELVYVTDPDTDEILFINEFMQKHFDIDESSVGQLCYKVLQKDQDCRCEGCPCDQLGENPDEKIVWEEVNTLTKRVYRNTDRYIKWPNGKMVHLQHAVDITEIKKINDELADQNIKLNLIVNGMNIGLWERNINPELEMTHAVNNEIFWSQEFRELLGFTDENDFPNKISSWTERIHPDDLKSTIDTMVTHLNDFSGESVYDTTHRIKLKSGEYRWFHSFGSTLRNSSGKPIRVAGASEDITERKEAEQKLVEQNEYILTMFQNAPVGLTVFDKNFKCIDCNEAVLNIYGVTREFYDGFFGGTSHSPEYQPDGSNSYEKAMDAIKRVMNGEHVKIEWTHLMPDGEPLPVELTMMRAKRNDEYVGLGYIYDMREQIRMKSEVESALIKAQKASEAKSAFLAKMSHEIRTPMNVILGVAEILIQNKSVEGKSVEELEKIYDSGNLLLNIINDILDLSKIEAGKLEIVPVNYDIPSLINDTVQLNLLRYSSKPIEFFLDVDENTPINLYGDDLRLKQILNNVLSNAFKYTDQGKVKMSVSAETKEADDEVIIVFRVSDTGQGMGQKQLQMLFDEYSRFNLEANRTIVGTGLGMTVAKQFVDLMNGEIVVESEENIGSVFTIRIPQKRVDNLVCGRETTEKLKNLRFHSKSISKKSHILREYMPYGNVLVVDDMESNVYVAKGMLLPYGLQIETVTSGFDAIEKIKDGKVYDIIFMDHMMPKMDGIQTTVLMRDMGYTGSIVALTANALIGQAEAFMKKGFDDFVSKPVDSRELNAVLNKFIRDRKPPEVVRAARQKQQDRQKSGKETKEKPELVKFFLLDAKSTLETLENDFINIESLEEKDINLYETKLHGIKSALVNIGETVLSKLAEKLEKAASEKNIAMMSELTPEFVDELKTVIEKYSQ